MTMKQTHGHQTYNEAVDPKQDYNHPNSEISCFNSGCQKKAMLKAFSVCVLIRSCQLSPLNMCENKKQ